MRFIVLPIVVAIGLLAWGDACLADEPDGPPLTLSAAVDRALQRRPEFTGFQFTQRVQAARQAEAGRKPQPQLEFLVEDAAGTGTRSFSRLRQGWPWSCPCRWR